MSEAEEVTVSRAQYHKSRKKNPDIIEWKSIVKDFAGHVQSFCFEVPMSDEAWTMIRGGGDDSGLAAKHVLMQITHAAQPRVMKCGVPWRCIVCSDEATTSVNTPAFHDEVDPPFVYDHCFLPICHRLECESSAHRRMHEIIQQEVAPAVRKEYGYDTVVIKQPSTTTTSSSRHQTCGNCGIDPENSKKLLRCARCRNSFYCSKQCQVTHWKIHKPSCVPVKTNDVDDIQKPLL